MFAWNNNKDNLEINEKLCDYSISFARIALDQMDAL